MPTFETTPRFLRDYRRLTPAQREAFLAGVRGFVSDLQAGSLHPGLRVKAVRGASGIYEMTWAPYGRATFLFGPPVVPGTPHVVWRRCGTHRVLGTP